MTTTRDFKSFLIVILLLFGILQNNVWAQINIYEAEEATIDGAGLAAGRGSSGTGYVDFNIRAGEFIEWEIRAENTGRHILTFFYQLGWGDDRPMDIFVNDVLTYENASFPNTGNWTSWGTIDYDFQLPVGINKIKLVTREFGGGNFDYVEVSNPPSISYKINFSDINTAAPQGWIQDFGLAFGNRGGNLQYGWVDPVSKAPKSLVTNGDNRLNSYGKDVVRDSYMAMDIQGDGLVDGSWEIEIPNGTYEVLVQVGDAITEVVPGTRHLINLEGSNVVTFIPGDRAGVKNAVSLVNVNDGILTLDGIGGLNTKLHMIIIQSVDGVRAPAVLSSLPNDGNIEVGVGTNISANFLHLPNTSVLGVTSLNNLTINNSTVKLYETSHLGDVEVPASVNGTGGGDAINLSPSQDLKPNTTYRFVVNGVKDLTNSTLLTYSSVFTTGDLEVGTSSDLDQVAFINAGAVVTNGRYTTLAFGPDGHLYGLTLNAEIHRWTVNPDGTLANEVQLNSWQTSYGERSAVGLVFDPNSSAENPVAYISHVTGGFITEKGAPSWDGKISRLSGPNLENEELIVTNLPRSIRDHMTNSMGFNPSEPNVLYFVQGSNSAGGFEDGAWGFRPERLLSAACLRLDMNKLPSQLPLDVRTTMDLTVLNQVDTQSPTFSDGTYNPYYVDAPLTIFGSGIRNAYDLTWHSNGQLYIPVNGTAGGSRSPGSVQGTYRPDGTSYSGQNIPAIGPNESQRDWLVRIDPTRSVGYYGHPNPLRGEYVLNRGSVDTENYPENIIPDPNFRGFAYDFDFNKSPNGVIEYQSEANGGYLKGAILVCRYSGGSDIIALVPDGPNGDIRTTKVGIPGFSDFIDPLDLVENTQNGYLYVSDFNREQIILLKPALELASMSLDKSEIVFNSNVGGLAEADIQVVNNGTIDLNKINISLTGPDAEHFSVSRTFIANLEVGESVNVRVRFSPNSEGPLNVQLQADVTGLPTQIANIAGLSANSAPSLQWLTDIYAGKSVIYVGDDQPSDAVFNSNPSIQRTLIHGGEAVAQLFEHVDETNPVYVEVLGAFGSAVTTDDLVSFGWYDSQVGGESQELFDVKSTQNNSIGIIPEGSLEFLPSNKEFGIFTRWPGLNDLLVYSQDNLNTFEGAYPHQMRAYPIPNKPDEYIVAFETGKDVADFQDLVVLIRNARPLKVKTLTENLNKYPGTDEGFPANDFFVFSRLENPFKGSLEYRMDDEETIRIHNQGKAPLVIQEFVISHDERFTLPNNENSNLPLIIEPGTYYDLLVKFIAVDEHQEVFRESLYLDANTDLGEIYLSGAFQVAPEGGNELSPLQITRLFGFTSNIQSPMIRDFPTPAQIESGEFGDIVASEYWEQADPNKPVKAMLMMPQAAPSSPRMDLVDDDDNKVGGFNFKYEKWIDGKGQTQSVYPLLRGDNSQVSGHVRDVVPGKFLIHIAGITTRGTPTINPNTGISENLKVKVFKAFDRDGKLIPNAYIVCEDAGFTGNGDFNDHVLYFENIRPVPEGNTDIVNVDCQAINFESFTPQPVYSDNDRGQAISEDHGATLRVSAYASKAISLPVQVGPNTHISFEFKSSVQGSYHAIALARDLNIREGDDDYRLLQIFGTEARGIQDYKNYSGDGNYQYFEIPLGDYAGGYYPFIVFTAQGSPNAESYFRNVKIWEKDGQSDNCVQAIGAASGTGLIANYFHDKDFIEPALTRIDPAINFNWQLGSPHSTIYKNNFSVRWEGELRAKNEGLYTFTSNTDNGVRLWLDGELMIDYWEIPAPTFQTTQLYLKEGQRIPIKMEMFEDVGPARAYLLWENANLPQEVIPITHLYPVIQDADRIPSPISNWQLNNDAQDAVGSNHGVIRRHSSFLRNAVEGEFAFDFNGGNNGSYIEVPNSPSLNQNNNFSISAWIRPDEINNRWGIFTKLSNYSDKQYGLTIHNGKLVFDYEVDGNNFILSGGEINYSEWQFVAVSVDANRYVKLFVNGELVAIGQAPALTKLTSENVRIGSWGGVYQKNNFDGLLDDVKFFDRALNEEDVYYYWALDNILNPDIPNVQQVSQGEGELLSATQETVSAQTLYKVYPNPTGDVFNLELPEHTGGALYQVEMYNLYNEQMWLKELGAGVTQIPVYSLPSGLYLIKIKSGEKYHTIRLKIN